jgi:hypothetical protein
MNPIHKKLLILSSGTASDGNAPVNVVPPTIDVFGEIVIGGDVGVSDNGTWTSDTGIISYEYQWYRDGVEIVGAIFDGYVITIDDVDTNLTCKVIAIDSDGASLPATSNQILIATVPISKTLPIISGILIVSQVLTSTTGTWGAIGTITYSYQWKRGGVDIGGANTSTYTLVQADAGQNITCEVTATTLAGSASATSAGSYILDADYYAVLDRGTTLGYTLPDATLQGKQNTLVISLKSAGIWNKLDILKIYATNNSNMATLNWKAPASHQTTLVNSPTFTANQGFKGNASTSYLNTNFNPATSGVQYTLNNASRFIYLKTAFVTANYGQLDSLTGSTSNILYNRNVNDQKINQGASAISHNADLSGAGLKVINRTSSTNVELFNGSTQLSRTATSTSVASGNQYVLPNGGDARASVYGMGASLVAENSSLKTILDTYVNSL